jgi:hypothetical protein
MTNETGKSGFFVEGHIQWWLLAVILAAIFFRLYNISNSSLWTDEFSTLWASSAPTLSETVERAELTQGIHPLYFIVQRAVLSFLPVNEASLRGLSCAASILSVFLIFWLGKLIFRDNIKALLASAIFAIHANSIYYAQEARPYSIGIMFALFSQIFFLRLFVKFRAVDAAAYFAASALSVFFHYVFLAVFLCQNIYLLLTWYLGLRKIRLTETTLPLKKWFVLQALCALTLCIAFRHISGMLGGRHAWNWLKDMDFLQVSELFFSMLDLKILAVMGVVFVIFYAVERFSPAEAVKRLGTNELVFLFIWLFSTPVFLFVISKALGVSFFDQRYMLLSMPALYLILANFLDIFRSDVIRAAFPGIYLIVYLGYVSVPSFMDTGAFCRRIPHNWKDAIRHIQEDFMPGDAILLRYGDVKENWIPSTKNPIILDYPRAPFHSFYWEKTSKDDGLPEIYSLTYTWDKNFYPYYEKIFGELVKKKRVWVIGVDPPNTNYRVAAVSGFMSEKYLFKKLYDINFSGVYLALLESNTALRLRSTVHPYYEELRKESRMEKEK